MRADVLFILFPYAAVALLCAGFVVRYGMARRQIASLRAPAMDAWRLFSGGPMWRAGLAACVLAHVVGLLLPRAILSWNSAPLRLYLLEGAGFLFGILALAGWARVMGRHLTRRVRFAPGEVADCVFLSLVFVAIGSGLLTAVRYRWGSSWAGATLAPYLATLAHGAPVTSLVEKMPSIVQLHMLSLFALLAVLPFTSVALVAVVAAHRAFGVAGRPIAAVRRAARAAVGRLQPARWLWPDEDLAPAEEDDPKTPRAPG
jgi:nitrate reductase gamma subunit